MKVLIADDEFVSRNTLKVFIKKLGYDVLEASDGAEAIEIWGKERPSIVVTDWNMPKMDGLEVCKTIRANEGEDYTYIIVVTGRDDNKDVIVGMEAGADDYITKPFNKDELNLRIKAGERVINLQSKDIVIFALAKLSESRDEDTGNHLERVRYYSKALAETLFDDNTFPGELDRLVIDSLFLTSPLHDIGKVGIPDYILLKPGRLDDGEFAIMKTHSEIGYQTLHEAALKAPKATYLKIAGEIARYHHEKWDGTGYPKGLKGDQTPLVARIFAIADVYDALLSKRPYKEPFSHDRALSIISDWRGVNFQPEIVDAFIKCQDEFIRISEEFAD